MSLRVCCEEKCGTELAASLPPVYLLVVIQLSWQIQQLKCRQRPLQKTAYVLTKILDGKLEFNATEGIRNPKYEALVLSFSNNVDQVSQVCGDTVVFLAKSGHSWGSCGPENKTKNFDVPWSFILGTCCVEVWIWLKQYSSYHRVYKH